MPPTAHADVAALLRPKARPLVGVIHLPPLAGPEALPVADLLARVETDAGRYAEAGFDAVLVENLGDRPYPKDRSDPHVAATMARAVAAATTCGLPVGANVLRNDAQSALAACYAGAAVTDQGIIEGDAHGLHAYRRALGRDAGPAKVHLFADIDVKHAAPLVRRPLDQIAADTAFRAGADVLLVTGGGTGRAADLGDVAQVARGAPGVPVWVASGATPRMVPEILRVADGIIVGSATKEAGDPHRPVDPRRATEFGRAAGKSPRPSRS